MKLRLIYSLVVCLGIAFGTVKVNAQATRDTLEAHLAAAKAAAKQDYINLYDLLCTDTGPSNSDQAASAARASNWHAEPMKVFDRLLFVGSKPVSAWAVTK